VVEEDPGGTSSNEGSGDGAPRRELEGASGDTGRIAVRRAISDDAGHGGCWIPPWEGAARRLREGTRRLPQVRSFDTPVRGPQARLGAPSVRPGCRPRDPTLTPRDKIRVMIVDDHPVVRFGLAAIISLQPDMEVAAQAGSGEQALEQVRECAPQVVLMDLRLPGLGGVEAIRRIKASLPQTRFIVLTTYDGDEDIYRALEAGAQAYLLKAMSHSEVTDAIRKVHSGARVIPEPISRTLADRPPQSQLSPRELQVLRLIADGLSNREIGDRLGITEATVKWHVNIILSRLNVADRTEAVVAAVQRGFMRLP